MLKLALLTSTARVGAGVVAPDSSCGITPENDTLPQHKQPRPQPSRPFGGRQRRIQHRQSGEAHDGEDEPPLIADVLVPDPQVAREFGVTLMSLWRWSQDPHLNFPTAIKIRNRNFRSRRALEAFKARMMRKAIADRKAL